MSITEKAIAGNQRRSLRAIRDRLKKMSEVWDEIDQFNMNALYDLADKVEQVATELVVEE